MKYIRDKYVGNPIEERLEFQELILKLQALNGGIKPIHSKVGEIKNLPEPDHTRLWEHLYHWCTLYIGLPNTQKKISMIYGNADTNSEYDDSFHDLCEDCKLNLCHFVYRYFWRKYSKESDPEAKLGIIISCCKWGFVEWLKDHDSHANIKNHLVYGRDIENIRPNISGGKKVYTGKLRNSSEET